MERPPRLHCGEFAERRIVGNRYNADASERRHRSFSDVHQRPLRVESGTFALMRRNVCFREGQPQELPVAAHSERRLVPVSGHPIAVDG